MSVVSQRGLGQGAGIKEGEAAKQMKFHLVHTKFQHQPWSIGGAHPYISKHFMKEDSHSTDRETWINPPISNVFRQWAEHHPTQTSLKSKVRRMGNPLAWLAEKRSAVHQRDRSGTQRSCYQPVSNTIPYHTRVSFLLLGCSWERLRLQSATHLKSLVSLFCSSWRGLW